MGTYSDKNQLRPSPVPVYWWMGSTMVSSIVEYPKMAYFLAIKNDLLIKGTGRSQMLYTKWKPLPQKSYTEDESICVKF